MSQTIQVSQINITEIIEVIAWPVACVIILLIFKGAIESLIRRITGISKNGITAPNSSETQSEKTETSSEAIQQLLDVVGNSVVINELEETIYTELKKKGLSPDGDAVKVLIKHLAGSRLLLAFEQIHNIIFGSQILLLKRLKQAGIRRLTVEDVDKYVDIVSKKYPEQLRDWDADQYLFFLREQSLIIDNKDYIHITNLGVEYITWIVRNGRNENKLL